MVKQGRRWGRSATGEADRTEAAETAADATAGHPPRAATAHQMEQEGLARERTPQPPRQSKAVFPPRHKAEQLSNDLLMSSSSSTSDASVGETEAYNQAIPLPLVEGEATTTFPNVPFLEKEHGEVYFPMMSEEEVAKISIKASDPPERLREVMKEHGVVLVTEVLSNQECRAFEELWLQDLLQVLPANSEAAQALRQEGVKAWRSEWGDIVGKRGSASRRGLPHGSFAWTARLHPEVKKLFADLFEVESGSLIVGLDNPFWSAADACGRKGNEEWLHTDQNHQTGLTWRCFQGLLYVWPSTSEAASTTVVWPGSHRDVYDRMMSDGHAKQKGKSVFGQSVKLNRLEHERGLLPEAIAGSRRVPCPAGSMLFWDSRTVHQGWGGGRRLAQPVCWEPRERRDRAALRRKIWMCATASPSSHSAAEGRLHGMASKWQQTPLEEVPHHRPAALASLVPFSISPGMERDWELLQDDVWSSGEAKDCLRSFSSVERAAAMLRGEVLASL